MIYKELSKGKTKKQLIEVLDEQITNYKYRIDDLTGRIEELQKLRSEQRKDLRKTKRQKENLEKK